MARIGVPFFCSFILALAALGCGESESVDDGGTGWTPTPSCPNGVDPAVDLASALSLSEGATAKGHVCPAGDKDYFKITVPSGKKLVKIDLQAVVANTPVDLTYRLMDSQGGLVAQAPIWTASGPRRYSENHCAGPGTYYVLVNDDGNDEKDGNNGYQISFKTLADPDTYEGNNTTAVAKGSTGQPGYISCAGDVDYYKVDAAAGKLLDLKLTNKGATDVDLKYTIYDNGGKILGGQVNANGATGVTSLGAVHALPKAGTYYVAVEDDGGEDSDPALGYSLALNLLDEPDANDKPTRNDSPATATSLGTYSCGAMQTFTITGAQIASQADADYYKVHVNNCSDMVVMEVDVNFNGSSKVDPTVAYIYPHGQTSCSSDTCCRVLNKSCASQDLIDCLRVTHSCVAKGETYCNNKDCESYPPSLSCASEMMCAGATVCLPSGKCGAEQAVRYDSDGSDGARVRTAHPLFVKGADWYIRVSDLKGDDYDLGKRYNLTVKVRTDPDGARELDSEYFSELPGEYLKIDTLDYHVPMAQKYATSLGTIALNQPVTVTGYLSYEGDYDWFKFDSPCSGDYCVMKATYSYTGTGCPVGSVRNKDGKIYDGLEFVFEVRKGGSSGSLKDSWPATPTTNQGGVFGPPNTCFLGTGSTSYYLAIYDLGYNMWSWTCGYSVRLELIYDSCQAPCKWSDTYNKCYV